MSLSGCFSKINSGKTVFSEEEIKEITVLANRIKVRGLGKGVTMKMAEIDAVNEALDEAIEDQRMVIDLIHEAMGISIPKTENPSEQSKSDETRQPIGQDQSAIDHADADFDAALGDLGDILGKNAKANFTPEQEQKILPVLTRLFDAAFRKGYYTFKEAARFVLATIKAKLGSDVSDQITLDHLQGAYIGMAGRYKDQGADKARDVVSVESKDELGDLDNVTYQRSSTNLERNREDANPEIGLGEEGVRPGRGGDVGTGGQGVQDAEGEGGPRRGDGVSGHETATAGERGNLEIYTGDTGSISEASIARDRLDQRSDSSGVDGSPIESDATSVAAELAESGLSIEQAKQKQKHADKKPSVPGIENIRETLPILTEGQQEDVHIAETRFAQPDGYGMLFTNGTGTGKTFLGLGIIKRFVTSGKSNIIIAVPNDKIAGDWQKAGKLLGLDVTRLENTQSAGSGVVITTYANFGQNPSLASRDWNLIVHDEAHYLKMDSKGSDTLALGALQAISLHPGGASGRARMLHPDLYSKLNELAALAKSQRMSDDQRNWPLAEATQKEADAVAKDLREKEAAIKADISARQGESRPRVLFLSATPFAYEKSVDWANGYLFDYNEGRGNENNESRGYNAGSNSDQFMMQHFGYRMRTGKLTQPDAKVDGGLMQRQFNTWLKKRGALAGRMLDVKADYDRRFVLVDSAIGQKIDEALQWFETQRKSHNESTPSTGSYTQDPRSEALGALRDIIGKKFDYLSRRYLLEAIKAREVIPHVREHLALGRKVVVFHDYKKGGGFNPFDIHERISAADVEPEKIAAFNAVVAEFRAEFKGLISSDVWRASSPITAFQEEFPGVLLFNGDIPAKQRRASVEKFQDDASGPQVLLVQSAAGKEGISLHDTTGKHQRVLFNLGQPTQPTTAIQQEGRIYRTGQVTDAIFRYLNTGTNWEKWAFATTVAQRASAAENLGMGEQARALKDAFIAGFEESDDYRAGMENEGKGGKERDKAANNALTEYDRARAFYFGTQKKNNRTKSQEGADYFATPEPVGLKMMELADIRPGESVLEPSAGHGAIARWAPDTADKAAIEPSMALRPRLAMVFDGKIIDSTFEDLNVVNKYDAIVMNPPFGSGGRTAIDHLAKAATHLRDGGRIVALIPTGPSADAKFDKWFYEESTKPVKPLLKHPTLGDIYLGDTVSVPGYEGVKLIARGQDNGLLEVATAGKSYSTHEPTSRIIGIEPTGKMETTFSPTKGFSLVADIALPSVTFERAGTAVNTRIVVIERSANSPQQTSRDYADATDINDLFDRMESLSISPRAKAVEEAVAAPTRTGRAGQNAQARARDEVAQQNGQVAAAGDTPTFEIVGSRLVTNAPAETVTTRSGKVLEGVFVPSEIMTKEQVLAVDRFTYKPKGAAGGWFVRLSHVERPGADQGTAIYKNAANIIPENEQLSSSQLLDIAEQAINQLGHKPSIMIVDSLSHITGRADDAGRASGLVKNGKIYLFRDAIADGHEAVRTIWHELLHYGIRRFLTADQYIKAMQSLAMRDEFVRKQARAWANSPEADKSREYASKHPDLKNRVDEYAFARGVDEALAMFAESIGQNGTTYAKTDAYHKSLRAVRSWLGWLADKIGMKPVGDWIRGKDNQALREYAHMMLGKLRNDDAATSDDWAFTADGAFMTAWHGSPHDHDKFDSGKIGTGEGAQAYGHGLYFSGSREVAEYYRTVLAQKDGTPEGYAAHIVASRNGSEAKAIAYLESILPPKGEATFTGDSYDLINGAINSVKTGSYKAKLNSIGRLYQVELAPSADEYLDWDKPLSEQSEKVRSALSNLPDGALYAENMNGESIYRRLAQRKFQRESGNRFYTGEDTDKAASEYLRSIGIRGISYLDGSSRSAGEGNHNFVIFDDKDVSITAKFSRNQSAKNDLQSTYEVPNPGGQSRSTPINGTALAELRRAAAGIEAPDKGVTFTVNADGKAIVTGPARTKVPARFQRFSDEHGLTLVVQRRDSGNFGKTHDDTGANTVVLGDKKYYGEAIPTEYREAGALYFGEMGEGHADRTGKSRFSRNDSSTGLPIARIQSIVDQAVAKLPRLAGVVRVVQSASELPSGALHSDIEGAFMGSTGQIYLVADNLPTERRARMVLAHESVGHMAMEEMLNAVDPALWGKLVNQITTLEKGGNKLINGIAKTVDERQPGLSKTNRVKEILALMAEEDIQNNPLFTGQARTTFQRFIDGIKAFMKLAFDVQMTDKDVLEVVKMAERHLGENAGSSSVVAGMKGVMLSRSVREEGMPASAHSISTFRNTEPLKAHPDYRAAKAGDFAAAARLVADLVTPANLESATERFGNDAIYAYPHAEEASGHNAIPGMLANYYATKTGGQVEDSITQANRAFHTGAGMMERMISRPLFNGEVKPGRYVVVDDVSLSGSTLAELADHIRQYGGTVVGTATLTDAYRVTTITPEKKLIKLIKERFGDEIERTFNISPDALTAAEAGYFANFRDADALRTRVATAKQERAERLRAKGLAGTQESSTLDSSGDNTSLYSRSTPSATPLTDELRAAKLRQATISQQTALPGIEKTPPPSIPQQPSLGLTNGAPGNRASWDAPEASRLDSFIYQIQNKHIYMKRVKDAIEQSFGPVEDKWNPYLKEELFHERAASRVKSFVEDELTPMLEVMTKEKISQGDLGQYLWARHAKEANAYIATINSKLPDGGSGMTDKESADYMAELDPAMKQKLEALAKQIDAINHKTRLTMVNYGLISPNDVIIWENTYRHYIPLNREDMDHMSHGNGTGQGFSIKGKETQRRTGSELAVAVDEILGSIAMQRERAIARGEKNRVGLALFGMTKLHPNPDFWVTDKAPIMKVVQNINGQDQVVEMADPLFKSRDNVVVVKIPNTRTGKVEEHAIIFNERNERAVRMASAIKNLEGVQLGEVMSATAKVTRYFAAINTQYNPIFGVLNLTRDVQTAMLNLTNTPLAGKKLKILNDTRSILLGAMKHGMRDFDGQWKTLSEEFHAEGGATGYRDVFITGKERSEALQKALDPDWWTKTSWGKKITLNGYIEFPMVMAMDKGLRPVLNWLSDYNEVMENATRLAAYKEAKAMGMSKERAASVAKNLTVNFNRKGEKAMQVGAMYAFFNAAVQGMTRDGSTLRGPAGKRIIMGGMLIGAIQAMALAFAGFGNDEPPEFVKERNLIIPIGGGKYLTLPMPLTFNVLPNLGRLATELILTGGKKASDRAMNMLGILLDASNPLGGSSPVLQIALPTALDPIGALAQNKNWTGKPIYREDFSGLHPTPGFTRGKDTSSMPSRWLAEAINTVTGGDKYKQGTVSPTPDQIDYLVGQVTGGVGREMSKAATTATALATGEDLPAHKVPLLGRFYGDTEDQSSHGSRFYDNLKSLNEIKAGLDGRNKDNLPTDQFKRDNPEYKMIGEAVSSERQVSALRSYKRRLMEKGADKAEIKAVDTKITAAMTRLNNLVERSHP